MVLVSRGEFFCPGIYFSLVATLPVVSMTQKKVQRTTEKTNYGKKNNVLFQTLIKANYKALINQYK